MSLTFAESSNIDPEDLVEFLGTLELRLASSQVLAVFRDAPPAARNEYALLQRDVTLLRGHLTVARLNQVSDKLAEHSKELKRRGALLRQEIQDLASGRRILTKLDKFVSMVSRIAIFLL